MMRAAAVVLIAGAALDVHATDGSTPPERTAVLDNATTTVTRLHFAPGAAESAHTHPYSLLIVQVTGGTVNVSDREMVRVGSRKSFAGERRSPRDRDQTRSSTLTGGAADGSAARDFPRDADRQRRGPGRPRPICAGRKRARSRPSERSPDDSNHERESGNPERRQPIDSRPRTGLRAVPPAERPACVRERRHRALRDAERIDQVIVYLGEPTRSLLTDSYS